MDVNLSQTEEKIIDFADSLANSDIEITINKLFESAKKNSHESAVELSKAINLLITKSYIVPGKRVTKDQLLLNGKRYRIYFYIRNNPSCSFSDIMEFTKIKEILINWHLAVLEEFQFIFHAKYQGKLVFYPIEYKDKLNTAAFKESKLKTETISPKIRLMDILGRKIIDALDIVSMLEKIGVACEERFIVGELISFLDQTQHKIEKTFPDAVWIAGHWKWGRKKHDYVWVPGRWVKPKKHRIWIPGSWEKTRRGWFWLEGYWK